MSYEQPELPRGHHLTAREMNALIAEVKRLGKLSFMAPMGGTSDESGISIRYEGSPFNLVRVWLPTGIAAGTFGSPALKTDAILAVRSGDGWTTTGGTTIAKLWNSDTTAITGAKAGWAVPRGGGEYDLYFADC
jgi:hypothetical protein